MHPTQFAETLGPELLGALAEKGYTSLTPVQIAVLDPALADRDLHITSQTGSGKTVAIGFALRELARGDSTPAKRGIARPRALVVTPTRELGKQVESELAWLYAPIGARIASATGGASYRDEHRALAAGPAIVVGTPGRLLDHLKRGAIDASLVGAIVLDEADRMLDLGFREDLEAILAHAPAGHRTHLVAATFPRDLRALAGRVQEDAAHVEGTRLGAANADIDHLVHLVRHGQRVSAIINLLLANEDEQTLVFARTRAEVGEMARELGQAGFKVTSLSGEMEQAARTRALAAFKEGELRVLVATDVAARGIDVQDIARVIHAEVPVNADTYTHRSGRTGRAGKKGTSSLLVSPMALKQAIRVLERAGVTFRYAPIPSADEIRRAADDRLLDELTREDPDEAAGFDERTWSLANELAASDNPPRVLARLLVRTKHAGTAEPRDVEVLRPPSAQKKPTWVPFRVTWGRARGADAASVLSTVCRRGGIRGNDVGAIRIGRGSSSVDVASHVAEAFLLNASTPDRRNPGVVIEREPSSGEGPVSKKSGKHTSHEDGSGPDRRGGNAVPKRPVHHPHGRKAARDGSGPPRSKRVPRSSRRMPQD